MENIEKMLIENPIIAAIRNDDDLEAAIVSEAEIIFVLYGNIISIGCICNKIKEKNKIVFVHIDLIEGLKGDSQGLEYIKKYADPEGIITTKISCIKHGKHLGFYTIQRVFVVDSLFLKTGIKSIHEISPHAIEVMPGIAMKAIGETENLDKKLKIPIIAGGLIRTKKDVMDCLSSGAIAVSTSAMDLWSL
ncbi:glycerol-3-phosphate responsive antiterminator [Clostridium tetani]|uniref:Glycerol-3-phosphate responsive antiterminator n=1 Tax=Clostridium tetani TaxID=1513 RepID=A0ABY0EML5_CLOTA|nr:glycerol-3-phosphate responsive antiterminator [Clostridium tetani]CDI49900.1 glycerol uptake operon antiterminator regulatoryprotein [Clostridium tetani 12124569]KHO38728.1 antiterminator [Clostridium tetani]RXI39528.1 glycerol-3-phosphate responsive antiterminator [Clostridium tetani]RXI53856.1 glycerol-3-phosphate responsive antiterminator [Clostridium tetani]RXI73467.1 glycerol-3-phosphate responsive antiterminator [Clostridium tetani]